MSPPVLITGGTQRIGLALTEHFLNQSVPVIVTYRRPKSALNTLAQRGATLIQADFTQKSQVERLILQIKSQTSALRAIIHNASDWASESADDHDFDLIERMMQVHVYAPYRINMALADQLMPAGDIIHFTDYVQDTGSDKHTAYAASKAALHNLTLSFAKKLAPQVKVNSIAPSLLMFNEKDDLAYRRQADAKHLLSPAPGAYEAVSAVDYLLNSDYITGQTLHLNGGRHLR